MAAGGAPRGLGPNILVVGNCNKDLIVHARSFPKPGETVLGDRYETAFGGKGANQAVAAGKLVAAPAFPPDQEGDRRQESGTSATATANIAQVLDVGLLSCLGEDDVGLETRENLRRCSVSDALVTTATGSGVASGVALITIAEATNSIVVAGGANELLVPRDVPEPESGFWQSCKVLLCQLESGFPATMRALENAKLAGADGCDVFTVLNTAPAAPGLATNVYFRRSLQWVDVVCANEVELAELSRGGTSARTTTSSCAPSENEADPKLIDSWEAAEAACAAFWAQLAEGVDQAAVGAVVDPDEARLSGAPRRGRPEWIVATLGARGCLIARESGERVRVPAPGVGAHGVASTVGAGDCFLGAFAYAFARGEIAASGSGRSMERMQKCVEFACRAATLSVSKPGVQDSFPSREELRAVYGAGGDFV